MNQFKFNNIKSEMGDRSETLRSPVLAQQPLLTPPTSEASMHQPGVHDYLEAQLAVAPAAKELWAAFLTQRCVSPKGIRA